LNLGPLFFTFPLKFDLVPRLKGKFVVTYNWIYKIKHTAYGSIKKYKAKFVARGFYQKEGMDYDETFFPVFGYTSIRVVVYGCEDITTFLNGVIEEEVYIEQH
jgi:hypothetical protein